MAVPAASDRPASVDVFIRDDDAGWDDARLFALLDRLQQAALPIDLAVIPQALGVSLAGELLRRFDAADGRLGLHQHGYAHLNHERQARKCEFGLSRTSAEQRQDLLAGRARLRALFGACLDPIFTPPWNRCASSTPGLLAALGYSGLSRDGGAEAQTALRELRVTLDWSRVVREARALGSDPLLALTRAMAKAIDLAACHDRPVGLMLHHAAMDEQELGWLERLLAQWGCQSRLRFRAMRELLAMNAERTAPPARSAGRAA